MCKEYVSQNSIKVVEKDSGLTISNEIVNETKVGRIDFSYPAHWPQSLTLDMRVEIVLIVNLKTSNFMVIIQKMNKKGNLILRCFIE